MIPQNWTENFIELNGVNLHYHRTGGDKTALVLLHGFTDNGLCWTRVAKELENKFDIIMPDCRGHGKSVTEQTDFSLESAAKDIVELIRYLKFNRPIIMGHSMGGQIATLIAANYPELISKLLLEDPAYILKEKSFRIKLISTMFRYMIKRSMNKTEEQLRKQCHRLNKSWDDLDVDTWANGQYEFGRNSALTVFENLSADVDWYEIFPKIKAPTLLLIPSKGILRLKDAEKIQPEFHDVKIAFIENAGHSVRRENFKDFMGAVNSFLVF